MSVEEYYDHHFSQNGSFASADTARAELVREQIPSGVRTVLEVGAGSGLICGRLKAEFDVSALELTESGTQRLKALGIRVEKGSVSNLPYARHSFDLVLASEVIEHLDSPTFDAGVSEIARVSARYVLITVPNRENLRLERQECPECHSLVSPWTHLRSFSTETLAELFDGLGFRALEIRPFGPLVPDTHRARSRLVSAYRVVLNRLRPGLLCPVCNSKTAGSAFSRPTASELVDDPVAGLTYAFDGIAARLSPKKPRWLLALFERGQPGGYRGSSSET